MPSLSCLSLFEPGAFASDSGNVIIPTADVPFPATALGVFEATAEAVVSWAGAGVSPGMYASAGDAVVSFTGASEMAGSFAATASAVVDFDGEDATPPAGDGDDELLLLLL